MGLAEIRKQDIMEAIDEFDELGRDEFLQKYGFGKAKAYFLEHDGKLYDSKAIVGAAHGYSRVDMEPLTSDELHGGKSAHPVIPFLENLGFKVTNSPPPSPTSPKADKEKVEKLVAVLKQHAGQRLSASDLKRETGVAKHRIRTLLRESPLGVDVEISPKPPYRFWWGETVEEFPLRLFSWEVLSRRVAKKKLDRSAFLHHGTGLPAAITWFFGISERGPRFREVCLVFNGETFDARIPADNQGRYRLFWGKDFASTLGRAFPDSLSAHQKKLKSNHDVWMQLKKLSAESYEVEFFPKLAGGSLTSTSRPPSPTTPEGGKEKTQKWTTDELRLVIEGYLEMSRRFQGGEKVVKRRYYADLASNIERTESSIERRM